MLIVALARGIQSVEHWRTRVMQFPHVLLEVKVSAKALTTDLAGKRLLIVMRMHVEG